MNPIKDRSQLIYALTEVAGLEHTLMCQYLFAASSIKGGHDEFPNKDRCFHQAELTRGWKAKILDVAREEMQHLTYAINLLISVGGSATFARPNFPNYNRFYKTPTGDNGLLMTLERFSIDTIERFINFEAPPPPPATGVRLEALVPEPDYYTTIHEFYTAIKNAFKDGMFVDYGDQYDPTDENQLSIRLAYRRNIYNIVSSAEQARKLVDMIMAEGEGSDAKDPMAHVNIFRNIRNEYQAELVEDPSFEPARPVLSNPMVRIDDDLDPALLEKVHIFPKEAGDGLAYILLQLSSGAYEILLGWLFQLFDQRGPKKELRAIETLAFLPYMSEIVRPLMETLTRVSVTASDGETGTLGPGFEVSSNDFLISKPQVTQKLTTEKLTNLQQLIDEAMVLLSARGDQPGSAVLSDLDFIKTSLRVLKEEFESRVTFGWPPPSNLDLTYSEQAVVPPTNAKLWGMAGPKLLELQFQGWFQCRLPSDPDGANEKRGVTGNNFAIGDEPDLDRIIRFQAEGCTVRSYCPMVGVYVTGANLIWPPAELRTIIRVVPEFLGAKVDLLDGPRFEGRNHIVSEDGEPIDPFVVSIETAGKIRVSRAVKGNGKLNTMTGPQRRGSGRYPINGGASVDALRENFKRMGWNRSPQEYIQERYDHIMGDLKAMGTNGEAGLQKEMLLFRKAFLEETRVASEGRRTRSSVRWSRFYFFTEYLHTLSGPANLDLNGLDLGFRIRTGDGGPGYDFNSKWLINYHLGCFDSDAMSGYVYGTLYIPVD
jgi:hypothetical protein